NDDRDAFRLVDFLPAAVLLVLADRQDDGAGRVVGPGGNLAFQGTLEGALEVAQRLRTGLADSGVFVAGRDNVLFAARLDTGQGQLLAQDGGQFFQGQFHFKDVAPRLV